MDFRTAPDVANAGAGRLRGGVWAFRRWQAVVVALLVCLAAGVFLWAMVSARPTLRFERFEVAADGRRLAVFTFENPTWFEFYWAVYLSRGPLVIRELGKPGEPVDAGSFTKVSPAPHSDTIERGVRIEMRVGVAEAGDRPFQLGVEYFPPGLLAVGLWNRFCSAVNSDHYVDPESRVVWSETVTP